MKTVSKILLIFAAALPAFASAPAWDSSGNNLLNGVYYFRQVIYQSSGGSLSGAYSYYGNISFSGTGTYSITSGTFVEYTSSGPEVNTAATTTGTYSVSSSGYGFMSSPVISGVNIVFLVSNGIIVGSETENTSGANDMFVAAPYNALLSLSSLSGTYTISSMFPNADATYQLSPSGGILGNVSISGYSTAGSVVTQNSAGVKYAYSNGAYSIIFPNSSSANFYSNGTLSNGGTGSLFLYSSPDSNFVFGGTQYGFDMFVGVRNASSGANTPLLGLYYEAGIDNIASTGLDTYYGSFNAIQGGSIIGHQRLLSAGFTPEGLTYYNNYPTSISGSYTDSSNTVNYTIGQSGIRIGYGTNGDPAIEVAVPYSPPAVKQSIYLDPTGIVNTASSAPYTAGISPGDFITLYNGVGLANSLVSAPPGAFPTTGLGGVTVIIDGVLSAPIYYVSATQISFLVPYEVSTYPVASIQVNNNGVKSNIATTYVNVTTPGVFTAAPEGGDGIAAMLDVPASGDYFIVSANQPANPGDGVALYLTGLGAPFPTNPDGALGPATGDGLVQTIDVNVGGVDVGTPAYLGLAPALAGLYQTNFTIPALCSASGQTGCINAGTNYIGISGPDSYSDESYIPVSSGGTVADVSAAKTTSVVRKTLPRLSKTGDR